MDDINASAADLFDRAARQLGKSNEEIAQKITEALAQHAHAGRTKVSRYAVAKWRKGETDVPLQVLIAACWAGGYTLAQIVALEPADPQGPGAVPAARGRLELARAVGYDAPSRKRQAKLRVLVGGLAVCAALIAFQAFQVTGCVDLQVWMRAAQAVASHLARPSTTVHAAALPPNVTDAAARTADEERLCAPADGCGGQSIGPMPSPSSTPTPDPTPSPTPSASPTPTASPTSSPEPEPAPVVRVTVKTPPDDPTPEPTPKHGPKQPVDPVLSPSVAPAPVPTVTASPPPLSAP